MLFKKNKKYLCESYAKTLLCMLVQKRQINAIQESCSQHGSR